MKDITIRKVSPEDAEELLGIYAPYVKDTAITFEYEVPSAEEFRGRIRNTLKKYPYIAAVSGGEILGYAYTGAFKERAAYGWNVETTVYVKGSLKKCGIGRKLYEALENISLAQNILNMNACIGYPVIEDEHLTKNSAEFHRHLGYRTVGTFHGSGYKFGRWYDMVWMEKLIGEHSDNPPKFIPFPLLTEEALKGAGIE